LVSVLEPTKLPGVTLPAYTLKVTAALAEPFAFMVKRPPPKPKLNVGVMVQVEVAEVLTKVWAPVMGVVM
jgi:hypothetical protein